MSREFLVPLIPDADEGGVIKTDFERRAAAGVWPCVHELHVAVIDEAPEFEFDESEDDVTKSDALYVHVRQSTGRLRCYILHERRNS